MKTQQIALGAFRACGPRRLRSTGTVCSGRCGRSRTLCLAPRRRRAAGGFALIITLSLLILLVVVAVGLLSLSAISLRTTGQGQAAAEARANARLALALAISQLQKHAGPDQRITAAADQLAAADGDDSAAAPTRRHWTGIYHSWPANTGRPEPELLTWLVSGTETEINSRATASQPAAAGEVRLVGPGTVGDEPTHQVSVPTLQLAGKGGRTSRIAWWTGDQNIKAAVATPATPDDRSPAALRAVMQGAPRNGIEFVSAGTSKPFEHLKRNDPRMPRVTSWQQTSFVADSPKNLRPLFHDLAPFASGLLTNVRAGGFRKDLSMRLELQPSQAESLLAPARSALYRAGSENGINLHELWAYYNLHKELKRGGAIRYTTGGTLPANTPYLQVDPNASACQSDDEFFFKQPVVISYQTVLSFEARPTTTTANAPLELRVVSDPIITLWNPLDVPVVVPTTAYITTKYWQIPYDILVSVDGGAPRQCPLIRSFSPSDSNYLSLVAGKNQQLVFRPGEVIKVSQSGNLIVKTGPGSEHNLAALAGFNFGGGVSYPVRDVNGNAVQIPATATIRYEARPNGYTAGQTASSGLVPPGYSQHTRHFSLTHHELYIGDDRGGNSLGYGGIYIDYDFGNRRLGINETRQERQAGTKPGNQRLYANRLPQVFPQITYAQGRQLTAAELRSGKAPFMIFSYNAKTEEGTKSEARTRYLARFNPKAHHVDFYDFSQAERDMLPYEYVVEPLTSWRNRSLETSASGNAYFGGGMNAELGNSFVTTHSVPREPIISLAALQHSFANGFEMQRPRYGYSTLNGREPLLPQISHAIGNSCAPAMIAADRTQGTLAGGRPLADHSYLANLALWDDWFFSGVAPQTAAGFSSRRAQRQVAQDFLDGTGQLPVSRYLADVDGRPSQQIISSFFAGTVPRDAAIEQMASLIRVDGMFNVNSTSVEAWKAMLAGLKGREIAVRSELGAEGTGTDDGRVPVANLQGPEDRVVDASSNLGVRNTDQWVGRRTLDEKDIDSLAREIVREVRRRGPFLSLGDFVNRRPGSDKDLARAGAIQNALDSEKVSINSAFTGQRGIANNVSSRFAFPDAERGPAGFGMPGVVKQADILTPIAPILSARSDSFVIRGYGEAVDAAGRVLARAWCEATVERGKHHVDPDDPVETSPVRLRSQANRTFGRRFQLVSFRWLHPEEV